MLNDLLALMTKMSEEASQTTKSFFFEFMNFLTEEYKKTKLTTLQSNSRGSVNTDLRNSIISIIRYGHQLYDGEY